VLELSGSRPFERFTASQIRKTIFEQPQAYAETERIALVSSMLTSLLIGKHAPIDVSDGSGMNLLNIRAKCWSWELLQATVTKPQAATGTGVVNASDLGEDAKALMRKLGGQTGVVDSHSVVGGISSYFVDRYGFSSSCRIVAGTGDNPSSLVGLQAARGDVVISLGTSDTLFTVAESPEMTSTNGHVLVSPADASTYIKMLCFKNGSLARERVRAKFAGGTWDSFDEALQTTPCGNGGWLGIYFVLPEIVPDFNASRVFRFSPDGKPETRCPTPQHEIRALMEGHFMSMLLHGKNMGVKEMRRVIATGGASANNAILQVIADVFQSPVYIHTAGSGSAALGAALRALHGVACEHLDSFISIENALRETQKRTLAATSTSMLKKAAEPTDMYVAFPCFLSELLRF
jgi:xylulokinase